MRRRISGVLRLGLGFLYIAPAVVPALASLAHTIDHLAQEHRAAYARLTSEGAPARPHAHPHGADHGHAEGDGHGAGVSALLGAAGAVNPGDEALGPAATPQVGTHVPAAAPAVPDALTRWSDRLAGDPRPATGPAPAPRHPPPRVDRAGSSLHTA